jgi:hypothetical protein
VIMEKQFPRRHSSAVALAAFILLAGIVWEARPQAAPSPAAAEQARPSLEIRPEEPAKAFIPAMVGQEADSFANYIHFPKDVAASADSAVQFYCDVSAEGTVVATYALIGNDQPFKTAVQSALDWGRFQPAKVNGKPVAVYLGGTVLFLHQDKKPLIIVSLATAEEEHLRKLSNYIQPQLIGGLRDRMQHARASMWDRPLSGAAQVLVKVTDKGRIESSSVVSELPKDNGMGEVLRNILQDAEWIPALNDGKPDAGQINIVANFGEN